MKKMDNKGFSLVELIIVLAIMAVLMAFAGVSLNYLNSTNRKQVANQVVAYIGKAQTYAMSKSNIYGVEFKEAGNSLTINVVYRASDSDPWTAVGEGYTVNSNVPFVVQTSEGAYDMNDGTDNTIVATFERTSGAFLNLYVDGSLVADGQITSIAVGTQRTVEVVWRTGKYFIQ